MNLSGTGAGQARGSGGGGDSASAAATASSSRQATAAAAGAGAGAPGDTGAAVAAEASRMKEAGNRAFRAGRYQVAAANYNGALEFMSRNCAVAPTATPTAGLAAAAAATMTPPKKVVMGGRDAAVCYANRAAARLMSVGVNVSGLAAAEEVREALTDCYAALTADPQFDRARLRAGSCLMKLGALKGAEATFRACPAAAAGGGPSEANKLAEEAARASSSLVTLRWGCTS